MPGWRGVQKGVQPLDCIKMVVTMNPCPCGYYPDLNRCSCTSHQMGQYLGKISQPFLSRMDICIEVPKLTYEELKGEEGEASTCIRERIMEVHLRQEKRYAQKKFKYNSGLSVNELDEFCKLDMKSEQLLKQAFDVLDLSARNCHRILKVARTIADLDKKENIELAHLQEAIGYRMVDKKFWGGVS